MKNINYFNEGFFMQQHLPVLLSEVIDCLNVGQGSIYLDCTFGAGGYTRKILEAGANKVIAFDRDTNVLAIAKQFEQEFGERFEFFNFSNDKIFDLLESNYMGKLAGIVYDLGVSSMQIDNGDRGFSFQQDGPLDMRMDQREEFSAYDIINNFPESELARIIYQYGDEKKSRAIAREIVAARENSPVNSTLELVKVVQKAVGYYRDDINPATRTFQALRIEVNKELEQLKSSLHQAKNLLSTDGRMVVVSFHSGEDKIVKSLFNDWCGKKSNLNRYFPIQNTDFLAPMFKFVHKGTIIAGKNEVNVNYRSRSAKLRAITKLNL